MNKLIQAADKFAAFYHRNQKRKYTGEPYIVHPRAVAYSVMMVGGTKEMIAAALCHDTVEDTDATLEDVRKELGLHVADYVYQLTDPAKPEDGNRDARMKINREHNSKSCASVKTIRLADCIDNIYSIQKYDPKFAFTFFEEKRLLLPHLIEGNSTLYKRLADILGV